MEGDHKKKEKETEDQKIDFLEFLPPEINLMLFSYLSLKDIAAISLVCRKSQELANDQSLWREFFKKKSSHQPKAGQEGAAFLSVIALTESDSKALANAAVLAFEAADLILQTPSLSDKLISGDDIVNIGQAHERAAEIIIERSDILGKCTAEELLNIASSHESIAIRLLESKEFTLQTLDKCKLVQLPQGYFFYDGGLYKEIEDLANSFLEKLAKVSHENMTRKQNEDKSPEIKKPKEFFSNRQIDDLEKTVKENVDLALKVLEPDFINHKIPAYFASTKPEQQATEAVAHMERDESLDPVLIKQLQHLLEHSVLNHEAAALKFIDLYKQYQYVESLPSIFIKIADQYPNLTIEILKQQEFFSQGFLDQKTQETIFSFLKKNPALAEVVVQNKTLFQQFGITQQEQVKNIYFRSQSRHRFWPYLSSDAFVSKKQPASEDDKQDSIPRKPRR